MAGSQITGRIVKVSGPLVVASGMAGCRMFDVVRVGDNRVIGEVIELKGDTASIQVYEETSGVGPGEPVVSTGVPLSVELGPGLIGAMFDGIQRPLNVLADMAGDFISRGLEAPGLDRDKKWHFVPSVSVGQAVTTGDIIGTVQESPLVVHKVMVPPGAGKGQVKSIEEGEYTVTEVVCTLDTIKVKRELPCFRDGLCVLQGLSRKNFRLLSSWLQGSGSLMLSSHSQGRISMCTRAFGSGKTVIQHLLG